MLALRLDARYNPDTDELEIMLPPDMNPAKLRIVRETPDDSDGSYPRPEMAWTDEEWAEIQALMNRPHVPKTGAEITAEIWDEEPAWPGFNMDGVVWVNEQKRRRQERKKWSLD